MEKYSLYCIRECPIGKPKCAEISDRNNSAFGAAFDMQYFVKGCLEKGCQYEKERLEYDEKEGD